jgi:hypothetical protein
MRYVTATIGAFVMFFSMLVIGVVVFSFLPLQLKGDDWTFHFGIFYVRGNPVLLLTPILAIAASIYSFRGSLRWHRMKAEKKTRANQIQLSLSN